MLISVIVPTLNEEANLPVTLRQLADHPDVELIVVDGGSTDQTVTIARHFTPYVFLSHPGRATQMNMGARHATGDILLFLHADTFLLPGAIEEIQRRVISDGAVGGAFDLHVDSARRSLRVIASISSTRSRLLRLPEGDQGVFVWRQVFEEFDGIPEIPIMEDIGLAWRLRREGRLTFIADGLVTSARRWNVNGVLETTLVNWWVTFLYFLGVSPRRLRRIYDGWLASGQPAGERATTAPSGKTSLQGRP
jgi:rSAM/selenodomain-associated transferase 2